MLIPKINIVKKLQQLKSLLEKDAAAYFVAVNTSNAKILAQLQQAIVHVNSLECEKINHSYYLTVDDLIKDLGDYLKSSLIPDTPEEKITFNRWINRIISVLDTCSEIPDQKVELRSVSETTLRKELSNLIKQRDFIINQIENEKKSNPQSTSLPGWEETKKELTTRIEQLRKELTGSSKDDMKEKDWNERITNSFNYLNTQSELITKHRLLFKVEYNAFLIALPVLFIFIVIWYNHIYCSLHNTVNMITIGNYFHFITLYIPIPIMIALFWLCIVQKNRASRILLAIDGELFRIKYLEGLLLSINRLSATPEDAVKRINESLDALTTSYLHQSESYNMIDKIHAAEPVKAELKEIISSLKELVNLIKHEQ